METWEEFKSWVGSLAKEKGSYYCRGHACDTWKLRTSFHRESVHQKISLSDYLIKVVPEIHYQISAALNETIDLSNEQILAQFLSLIQHHGFPTPLLDWTLSPYIAAYFAFREVNEQKPISENIRIYLFDYLEWNNICLKPVNLIQTKGDYVTIIRPYARNNSRIIAQQGVFTITNVDNMEEYILSFSERRDTTVLYTVEISVKEKPHVMRELNLMGINEMTMFPGIGGICRSLKSQFFSPDTVGLTPKEWQELFTKPETKNFISALGAGLGIGKNALSNYPSSLEPEAGGLLNLSLPEEEK